MAEQVTPKTGPQAQPRAPRSLGLSPAWWALLAGAFLLVVYLTVLAFTTPNACGYYEDDAIYLVTAKALAEGHGYRRIDLPGEPHQTKYPVLYPFLLSLVWRVAGEYPANLPWLRMVNVLLAAGAVLLGVWYAARHLPLGKLGVGALAVLCLTTPELRLYSYFTMSELLFAGLALAALILAERAVTVVGRGTVASAILCGLVAGLAFLSRSIGLTLIVALVVWGLYRKRFALVAWCGVFGVVLVGGYWLWRHNAVAADGAVQQAALLQYELDYGAWLPRSVGEAARVVYQNSFRVAFNNFFFILRLPVEWLQSANADGGWRLVLVHLGVWVCLPVSLIGFLASARSRLTAAHVFLLAYTGAVLLWPFEPLRFLAPVFVFVIAFHLLGWSYLAGWLGRVRLLPRLRSPFPQLVALAACVCLTGLYVAYHRALLGFDGQTCRVFNKTVNLAEHHRVTDQLRQNAPPDAVIAAHSAPEVYLATGRKAVNQLPSVDPIGYAYSPSRDWRTFYMVETPEEAERMRVVALAQLDQAYREVGVRFLIVAGRNPPAIQAALAAHRAVAPDRYRIVYRPADANVAVFELLDVPSASPPR
ncbi:MAG TPA: hypothetical protein VM243_14815 [Phycisphaerae bacterium]|nr:hypothetical protein [Phycisphaerae bacterium]